MATIPAPRRPRELVDRDEPVRADLAVEAVEAVVALLAEVRTEAAPPVASPRAGAGAVPHESQYPSTIVPPHPGSAHVMSSSPASAR
jgi:hypothetical protein